jgi:copper chaperone CopZ
MHSSAHKANVERRRALVDNPRMGTLARIASIAALAAILGLAAATWVQHRPAAPRASAALANAPQRHVELEVGGMVCDDCVRKVSTQLRAVPGVTAVNVELAQQRAHITCATSVADTALTSAVRRAGHDYLGLVLTR